MSKRNFTSKPIKIIAYCGPSGSRLYRVEQIFKYLNRKGEYQCLISPNFPNDTELSWADMIFLQHTIEPRALADAWAYKIEKKKKIITDIDDTLQYKESSPFYDRNKRGNAKPWMMELLKISDLVTCTTKPLYWEAIEFNKNVHILPNYLDMEKWDIPTVPNETNTLRIGWSGSITHRPDLDMVAPVIKKILKSHTNVKFVSCGDDYANNLFKDINPVQHEYVQAMPEYIKWPMLAHTLMYDIGIAPLTDEYFNKCKSSLKYLEYAMTKASGIYSPQAYKKDVKHGVTGLIANSLKEWEKYLELLITDVEYRHKVRDNAYNDVRKNWSIEKHIGSWDKLYKELLD